MLISKRHRYHLRWDMFEWFEKKNRQGNKQSRSGENQFWCKKNGIWNMDQKWYRFHCDIDHQNFAGSWSRLGEQGR